MKYKYLKSYENYSDIESDFEYLKNKANEISNILLCDKVGSCVHFAELFVEVVAKERFESLNSFDVIEGYVNSNIGGGIPQQHTWIELNNGEIIDPTFLQFSKYDKNSKYINRKQKRYTGLKYYEENEKDSWFSERRKKYPHHVYKSEYLNNE